MKSESDSSSGIAWVTPLATSAATANSASVEKRETAPARSGVRSWASSTRVAAGTARSSVATPPTQTDIALT